MWYEQLDIQEKTLVEQQVNNNNKSLVVSYLLWFFLGMTGAHRFYVNGATGASITQLIMFILGSLTTFIFIGFIILFILGIWILIDAFLLPGMVSRKADELKEEFSRDILATRRSHNTIDDLDF